MPVLPQRKLKVWNPWQVIKVEVNEDKVSVDLSLNVSYNYNIPEVSAKVQEKVKNAIENMTGLTVLEVNIKIASVVTK